MRWDGGLWTRKPVLTLLMACLLLICACASAEEYTGVWNTVTGESVTLALRDDGTGSLSFSGTEQTVDWTEGEQNLSLSCGETTYTAAMSGQFLMLMDQIGHVWALTRDLYDLPGIVQAESMEDFLGRWRADYALVSGIRISMDGQVGPYTMEIAEQVVHLQGSGMDKPVDWVCRFESGSLILSGYSAETDQSLHLRADGTLTRDMDYMVIHFVREQ